MALIQTWNHCNYFGKRRLCPQMQVSERMKYFALDVDIPIVFIGDVKHSRVYSSTKELLNLLGFKVGIFTSEFFMPQEIEGCYIFSDWEEVISSKSTINLLRVLNKYFFKLRCIHYCKSQCYFWCLTQIIQVIEIIVPKS